MHDMFSALSIAVYTYSMCACATTYALSYVHLGTLLCSSLENNTIPSAIISIQVNGVEGLSDALATSPIHLQFEVVLLPAYIILNL